MRFSAVFPVLMGIGAIILSILCMFAGSEKDFLPNYPILTLNTSQIGANVLDGRLIANSTILTGIVDALPSDVKQNTEAAINALAKQLGINDFYNVDILSWCEGKYTPVAIPTAQIPKNKIHKNITSCSGRMALYQFSPRRILQQQLDAMNSGITLTDLNWPNSIDQAIDALHTFQKAAFILYIISICTVAFSTIFSLISCCMNGRISAIFNIIFWTTSFGAILLASILVTAFGDKATNAINQYGNPVDISADMGAKYLGLTWGAFVCVFLSVIYWVGQCCVGHRRTRRTQYEKTVTYS